MSMLQTHKLIDLVDLTTFHIFKNTVDPDLKNQSTRSSNGICVCAVWLVETYRNDFTL